ncbi:uncharacterized protein [Ambystoma mexicanum]|uniref:uncharacterized protein n=1 Tax=Ambystoma mexicanum TaxID=8296 RepID=UPI0037E8ECED
MLPNRSAHPDSWRHQPLGEGAQYGGCARGNGSPLPGDPASPQGGTHQSPSSPGSGLTEQRSMGIESGTISPTTCPQKPTTADPKSCTGTSHKTYVGVRVRMPVKEILRKIRTANTKVTSDPEESVSQVKTRRFTKKGRVHPYSTRRQRQTKDEDGGGPEKNIDDEFEVLYEILQKDMNRDLRGTDTDAPNTVWRSENRDTLTHLLDPIGQTADSNLGDCRLSPGLPDGPTPDLSRVQVESPSSFTIKDAFSDFYGPDAQDNLSHIGHHHSSSQLSSGFPDPVQSIPPSEQDKSTFSFFQFQILQEELRLQALPLEVLFALDERGKGLIHNAVIHGRRALVYALAKQLAALNNIDIKDATSQTALHMAAGQNQHLMVRDLISLGANVNERDHCGKTPLHICAENGYWNVLEIFKKTKDEGLTVQVDMVDNNGLTALQCAIQAQNKVRKELQRNDLTMEAHEFLLHRKDQLCQAVSCLQSMGADPLAQDCSFLPLLPLLDGVTCPLYPFGETDYLPPCYPSFYRYTA